MNSFRKKAINHSNQIAFTLFLTACMGYTYLDRLYIPPAENRNVQRGIISDAKESIIEELTQTAVKREILLNLVSSKSYKLDRYKSTNINGEIKYDFDAISRTMIMDSYKAIPSLTNKSIIVEAIFDAGRIQGLEMAVEIISEIEKQNR